MALGKLAATALIGGKLFKFGGGLFSAFSSFSQSRQQAQLAETNAALAARDASAIREQARFNAQESRLSGRKVVGKQRANIGASGVEFSGSALDLLAETAKESEREALKIEALGEFGAGSQDVQAAANRQRAAAFRKSGSGSLVGGALGATAGLLSSLPGTIRAARKVSGVTF